MALWQLRQRSEFDYSRAITFTFRKDMNTLISPTMGWIVPQLSIFQDSFAIK